MNKFSIVGNVFVSGTKSNVLNESEKLLMKRAIKGNDANILTSIVEKHANKNPLVDAKTKETLLHYIAYRLDGLDLFVSIANQVDNLYVKNLPFVTAPFLPVLILMPWMPCNLGIFENAIMHACCAL